MKLAYDFQLCLIVAVGIAWVVVIYKSRVLFGRDRGARVTWAGIFFLMLYQTASINSIRTRIDTLLPNLSWLLAYAAAMIGLYYAVLIGYSVLAIPAPRWMRPALIAALLLFGTIYLAGIVATPSYYDRTVPRSVFDLAFANTAMAYDIAMCSVGLVLFLRLSRQPSSPATRLRWGMVCAALALTGVYLAAKVAVSCVEYFDLPGLSVVRHLLAMRPLVWLIWPLALLSNKHYLVLLSPLAFADQVLTFIRLRRMQAKLHALLCRLEVMEEAAPTLPLYDLRNLSFHVHRTFVSILDGKLLLAAAMPDISDAELVQESLAFCRVLDRIPASSEVPLSQVYKSTSRLLQEL